MVHLTPPSIEEGKDTNHKKGLNGVDENMASRLAALTKALKDKIPHKNGVIGVPVKAREMKTEAKPTCHNGPTLPIGTTSGTHSSSSGKDSSSDYITKHCTGLLKKTASRLSTSQSEIEQRVTNAFHTLRQQQLCLSHSHTTNQLEHRHLSTSDILMHRVDSLSSEVTPFESPLSSQSFTDVSSVSMHLPSSSSNENASLPSFALQKHLQGLGSFVDDEATCSSSDEEEDDTLLKRKRQHKQSK